MGYKIKEIFYTLQGEGARSGRASVFCRFSGCNLWSGREQDRQHAVCQFCDTQFVGTDGKQGGNYTLSELIEVIVQTWQAHIKHDIRRYIVLTGGEPLLQADDALITALHAANFEVAVESNGTQIPPKGIDWLTISPKRGSQLVVQQGQELKVVYPQAWTSSEMDAFTMLNYQYFYLQPMHNQDYANNLAQCIDFCQKNPRWQLCLQTHKIIGIA